MRPASALSIATVVASAACSPSGGEGAEPASPCVAFAKAGAPALRVDSVLATRRTSPIVSLVSGAGRTYALDRDGRFGLVDAEITATLAANAVEVVVSKSGAGVRAFAARWTRGPSTSSSFELVRFTSPDDGLSFDLASAKVLFAVAGLRDTPEATSLALDREGILYVALGDAFPAEGAPATSLGKILRLDVRNDAALPETVAVGVHEPRGLDVDAETGDVWLTDRTKDDTAVVHRIAPGSAQVLVPALYLTTPERRPAFGGGHVHRGRDLPSLIGQY